MPMTEYLSLLSVGGTLVQVGNAPAGELPAINAFSLIVNNISISGSAVASPKEIREMIQLFADKNMRAVVEQRPMKDANQVMVDMEKGLARYRYVLVNEKHTE